MSYLGFTVSIAGVAAPWMPASFGTTPAGLARMFAWMSLSAIGSCALGAAADRVGRRPVIRGCALASPILAMLAARAMGIWPFVAISILLSASTAAAFGTVVVWLSEDGGDRGRAGGQANALIAAAAGSAACLMSMPVLVWAGLSWRWLLWASAGGGMLLWPIAAARIGESRAWLSRLHRHESASDLFGPQYRRRTWPVLLASALGAIGGTATAWRYFHAVSDGGLAPATASLMMLVVGGVSLAGFMAGARACDRFGRVPTVLASGMAVAGSVVASFWGPPGGVSPLLWLAGGYLLLGFAINAASVSMNTLVTELFPVSVRGSVLGALSVMGAIAYVVSQVVTAAVSSRIGVAAAIGWLGWAWLAAAAIIAAFIVEPRREPSAQVQV